MPRTPGAKDLRPRARRAEKPYEELSPAPEGRLLKGPPKPWHLTAIRMYAGGMTKVQIAEELHHEIMAVTAAVKSFPDEVAQAIRELAQPEKMFLPMMPKAAAVYHQILERDTAEADAATLRVQQSVAGDVFDRAYGRPVQRNINEGHHEVTITFVDAPNEDTSRIEGDILAQLNAGKNAGS